jgi:hypothetical protein
VARKAGVSAYSWHIPRRGAPQAPHGPLSDGAVEGRATANTESSFSTRRLSQFLQVTSAADALVIFSNVVPQS